MRGKGKIVVGREVKEIRGMSERKVGKDKVSKKNKVKEKKERARNRKKIKKRNSILLDFKVYAF